MSDRGRIDLPVGDPEIRLHLYRYADVQGVTPHPELPPVLLLHGASANHRTFKTPKGAGLAEYLAKTMDPWLLDWRGSGLVLEDPLNVDTLEKNGDHYNFNRAAQEDVPTAIRKIREIRKHDDSKVAVLGFCMGGAILAEAIARAHVTSDDVERIVLMTLGLFYEAPIDGRLKSEDRVLERIATQPSTEKAEAVRSVDPRVDSWPTRLDTMYKRWPSSLRAHKEQSDAPPALAPVAPMCNRLSFMYGMPYHHRNLVDQIHGTTTVSPVLEEMFGAIPLHMFIHGARNVRQGQATYYPLRGRPKMGNDNDFVSEEALGRFRELKKVTLITGALNRLWHRDSIDLMYEWLTRGSAAHLDKVQKHIFPTYGHQDLLWGKDSEKDVFETIREGLS